jgi:hypothetical protein
MPRKSKSKQQKEVIMSTPSTALLTTITPSCSKSRTGSVRSTSSTRSGPLRAIQNVFKVAASPLKSRSRLLPPPHKITIKLQEPRPFLSPLPAVTSSLPAAATAVATTSTPKSYIIVNKNTTTTKITSAAAAMRSQADIPRFIIINLNYYDDVPLLDMESPLKRRGVDAPSSSIIINNNNHSLHEA